MAFWGITYILLYNSNQIPNFITITMWVNAIIIVIALIVGFGVIQISVDQWFPDGDGDMMAMKDRILVAIVVCITIVCGGMFILTIVNNNISLTPVEVFDNVKLDMLMCILANTYVAFAYFQHFRVATLIK